MMFAFLAVCLFGAQPANAIVLDWSNVTWTAGSLTGSFDIDPNNAGNDVTVTITGNTTRFFSSTYPRITSDFTGGLGSGTDQLDLYVDYASTSQAITVTVTFHYTGGVSDVSTTLFDVDTGAVTGKGKNPERAFVDQVRAITAIATNNTLVGASISVVNSTYAQTSGSGTNQTVTGLDVAGDFSSQGSVGISYGTNTISSFTFTYGEGAGSETDPFAQGIGLYDITYTPKTKVPEFHPGLVSAALCLLLVMTQLPKMINRTT